QSIIIIGGGNIGTYIAKELEARTKTRLRIVEKDRDCAEKAAENLSRTVVLNGDALDTTILDEAGVSNAQTVICVTNDDKTNILAGIMAKSAGAQRVFSLINDTSFLSIRTSLGIDMVIDPRMTTVSSILRHVRKGRIHDVFVIDDGFAEVIEGEVLETSPLSGKTVEEISRIDGISFGALIRDDEVYVTNEKTQFKAHDRIVLFAEITAAKEVENLFRVGVDYF
ncbi:MAG TPA: Trk system potassium transport protein TrkA, partial [Hellea balneolensis]|nr:Trk system potassium transport protein TrkA [Hellea balneolensis]